MQTYRNRKAEHEYFFVQELEAGIVLTGTEIKSIRQGKINFKDSYAKIVDNEVWLMNLHISPYDKGSYTNHEAERKRKLLLNRYEIRRLKAKIDAQGMTLVPREVYINDKGLAKVKIALAKGKHSYEKRESIQKKEIDRDIQRSLKDGH